MKAWRHVVFLAAVVLLLLAATTRAAPASASATLLGSSSDCRVQTATSAVVTHRAGLIVTFGDRSSQLFCIEFAEDSISGLELLQRSGLPLVLSGSGAVCSIGGEGSNDPTDCFTFCEGGDSCEYWAYYQWSGGAWKYSPVGPAQRTVRDGDIDGWAWGPGGLSSGAAPGQPGDICPQPTATPTAPTATPTRTPMPAATGAANPTSIATTTAPASPTPSTIAAAPTIAVPPATKAPTPLSNTASPVSEAAGAARTPIPSSADASAPSVAPSLSATPPRVGVIVGAREGERNAGRSQRPAAQASTSARKTLIGFGSVASALAGLAGFLWYRRRQAVD